MKINYPNKRYTGVKPWMNYDWLYDEYIVKNRRSQDIADEFGCKQSTIQSWLLKHGIKKQINTHCVKPKYQYETYEYLYHHHIELHESISDISRANNVSGDTIRYNLQKNGINYWVSQHRKKYSEADIDEMQTLYCDNGVSAYAIAKKFNTSHGVVIRYLKDRGINTRNPQCAQYVHNGKEMHEDLTNRELLKRLHWDEGMSCKEIGALYGVNQSTVQRQMHRLGIETKNNSESKIGLMRGDKHPNWKGGVTSLNALLREYFHINIAPIAACRDEYQCQVCGKKHTVLNVHHIIPFATIVQQICCEHGDIDINDGDGRAQMYATIVHDKRFLDLDNLITLCKDCHVKIHSNKIISNQASKEEGSETIQ